MTEKIIEIDEKIQNHRAECNQNISNMLPRNFEFLTLLLSLRSEDLTQVCIKSFSPSETWGFPVVRLGSTRLPVMVCNSV